MGICSEDLDYLIPHQTSVRAIRAGTKNIARQVKATAPHVGGGLPKHIVYNLESFGNTASTTHFVALYLGILMGIRWMGRWDASAEG